MPTIKIKGTEKRIRFDVALLTVKKREELKRSLKKPEQPVLVEDKNILAELESEFIKQPPNQADIYAAFLRLAANSKKEEEIDEDEFDIELARYCCRWVKPNGTDGAMPTRDEIDNLPFDLLLYIRRNLFSEEERSFLVETPASA